MKSTVQKYGVKFLVHFTQADNLKNIFNFGILPISQLSKRGIQAKVNDQYRLDFCESATSTSIEFPNYRVFYKFRMDTPNVDWVVLILSPNILWKKKCVFCTDNAANGNISQLTIDERMGTDAFERMYEEVPGKPTRATLGIEKSLPTNPQAEVLVFDEIETKYIAAVIFQNKTAKDKYQNDIPGAVKLFENHSFFDARKDYEHWRS